MPEPQRVTIIGATGPTGRELVDLWLARGATVRVVSRNADRLTAAFDHLKVEPVAADAKDPYALADAVAGSELVFDCIGLPADQLGDHLRIAQCLVAACAQTGARCVQISSFWPYLPLRQAVVNESHPREGGPFAARMRRVAEDVFLHAGVAVVEVPDFYGPRVGTRSVLNRLLADAAKGGPMNGIGGATVKREHAYVPDAMATALELSLRDEAYGERWLLPTAGPLSLADVQRIVSDELGRPVAARGAPAWLLRLLSLFSQDLRAFMPLVPDYVKPVTYDASKLRELLGEVPITPYAEGIATTLAALAG